MRAGVAPWPGAIALTAGGAALTDRRSDRPSTPFFTDRGLNSW
ncbi:hypothetical protein [Geitlerinema sp. PCC 7407]|nr:hypothetical protein [Geitlerinema sp. PCC 7407]